MLFLKSTQKITLILRLVLSVFLWIQISLINQAVASSKTIIAQIPFDSGSAKILPKSIPTLDDVVKVILENQANIEKLEISGHTDSIEAETYNLKLSEQRAYAVRNYFIEKGVPALMLQTVGYGDTRPVNSNDAAEARANNRRVDFRIYGK